MIINHQGEVRGISYIILQSIRSLLLYIIIVTTISLTSGSMIIAILISPNFTMRSQLNIYPSSCIKRTCHNILDEDQQNNRDPTHYNVFFLCPRKL